MHIRYLGVWDTVGALGVPKHFLASGFFNRRHRFHDYDLSSIIESARHAVALDEFRQTYEPALWKNLDKLNKTAHEAGWFGMPFRQTWFPGDHSSVGGGGDTAALSSGAFSWIAEGAEEAGLALQPEILLRAQGETDHRASLRSFEKSFLSAETLMRKRTRGGPEFIEDVGDLTHRRWGEAADALAEKKIYRPSALTHMSDAMEQWQARQLGRAPSA